jgi:ferric-dicitrate binding protein FerR (iron transport regulator)
MTLAPSSRVVAVSAHPGAAGGSGDAVDRLTLVSGRAHLSIATLERGRTFRVLTDAATVRGHGTEFDVEVGKGPTPRTCVRVQDGLVEVTAGHEPHIERTEPTERTFVKHGESWGCDPPPATVHRGPAPPFP